MRAEWLGSAVIAMAWACSESVSTDPTPDAGPAETRAPLRMKKYDQLEAELTRILDLEPGQLCREVDGPPCASEVHRLVLGGADALHANVYDPDPEPGPTTPLAWDRVVLATCRNRVQADLKTEGRAGLFRAVSVDDAGRIDPNSPAVQLALETLARRAWLRDLTDAERTALTDAYAEFESDGRPDPAVRWGASVCAAVLSSREFVFY